MHVLGRAFVEVQVKSLKDEKVESSVWEIIFRAQGNWGSLWTDEGGGMGEGCHCCLVAAGRSEDGNGSVTVCSV